MRSQELSLIILSFVMIATFIVFFFFKYVSRVESRIIQEQITEVVDDTLTPVRLLLPENQRRAIGTIVSTIPIPDMKELDDKVEKENKRLFDLSIKVFSTLVITGIIIVLYMWRRGGVDMSQTLTQALIILGLVALTEYLFVTYISANYRLIDSNFLNVLFLKTLRDYSKE